MYWVEWNTRNASPARKSREESRPKRKGQTQDKLMINDNILLCTPDVNSDLSLAKVHTVIV